MKKRSGTTKRQYDPSGTTTPSAPKAAKPAARTTAPKYAKGPTGIGETGRGAPFG